MLTEASSPRREQHWCAERLCKSQVTSLESYAVPSIPGVQLAIAKLLIGFLEEFLCSTSSHESGHPAKSHSPEERIQLQNRA